MTRFGDLLGGKKVEEVVGSPIVEEDTTNYEAVIEEEIEDTAPSSVENPVDPEPSSMNGGYYIPSATGTSPLEAG